jgi:hypothetical protein
MCFAKRLNRGGYLALDGVCPHRSSMWNIAEKSFFSNSRSCNLYVRVRGSSRVKQGALCELCWALLGPCAYPERKCALCVVAIQADGPMVDVTRTLVTGRRRQGVCRAREHGLGTQCWCMLTTQSCVLPAWFHFQRLYLLIACKGKGYVPDN